MAEQPGDAVPLIEISIDPITQTTDPDHSDTKGGQSILPADGIVR